MIPPHRIINEAILFICKPFGSNSHGPEFAIENVTFTKENPELTLIKECSTDFKCQLACSLNLRTYTHYGLPWSFPTRHKSD